MLRSVAFLAIGLRLVPPVLPGKALRVHLQGRGDELLELFGRWFVVRFLVHGVQLTTSLACSEPSALTNCQFTATIWSEGTSHRFDLRVEHSGIGPDTAASKGRRWSTKTCPGWGAGGGVS